MMTIATVTRTVARQTLQWTALAGTSKNASKTEPAKLLVFLLSQEGESLKVPSSAAADNGR